MRSAFRSTIAVAAAGATLLLAALDKVAAQLTDPAYTQNRRTDILLRPH